jgi:GNAT superfamily N-acetyltransferase
MIKLVDDIYFSSKTEDMDLQAIFNYIGSSYWGNTRTIEEQEIVIQNSMNFGLFHNENQIAYSRVMTDKVFFAYLLDVYVIEEFQGRGLGKLLMDKVLSFPSIKNVDKWMLATKDAHGLYEQFGFEIVKNPSKLMDKMSERAKLIYEQGD